MSKPPGLVDGSTAKAKPEPDLWCFQQTAKPEPARDGDGFFFGHRHLQPLGHCKACSAPGTTTMSFAAVCMRWGLLLSPASHHLPWHTGIAQALPRMMDAVMGSS